MPGPRQLGIQRVLTKPSGSFVLENINLSSMYVLKGEVYSQKDFFPYNVVLSCFFFIISSYMGRHMCPLRHRQVYVSTPKTLTLLTLGH